MTWRLTEVERVALEAELIEELAEGMADANRHRRGSREWRLAHDRWIDAEHRLATIRRGAA